MTHDPRTREEIFESLRDSLTGKIAKLTNFTERSFNYVFTQAFSEELRELEVLSVVSELAGFIDYSGGPITEDDLEELGIADRISAEEVNEHMRDEFLDELVKVLGVTRLPGSRATGEVTFTTQISETTIPKGTSVTTVPDEVGNTINFVTTERVESANGVTVIEGVQIQAVDVGERFNIPANEIIRLADPPIGVNGVTNPESTTGGQETESNNELRERAKDAVGGASEGGTVDGIKSFIINNVEGVQQGDVLIDEFFEGRTQFGPGPSSVDVIVDGGLDDDVIEAINFSRPTGIRHNLIRPQTVQIGGDVSVSGESVDTAGLVERAEQFFLELGIGETFFENQLVRDLLTFGSDIQNTRQNLFIERVTNEIFTYSEEVAAAFIRFGPGEDAVLTNVTIVANGVGAPQSEILPEQLFVDDAYFFGAEQPFSEIAVDMAIPGAGQYSIEWEYLEVDEWVPLQNVTDETNELRVPGRNTVSWDVPTDWTSFDLGDGGVSVDEPVQDTFFVRARIASIDNITSQPLPAGIDITGSGYSLDYTYEDTNGSITVIDQRGKQFTEGSDFELIDKSGDGFLDTLIWSGGLTPENRSLFAVDYDVTVSGQTPPEDEYSTQLIRDEELFFDRETRETFTFTNAVQKYKMEDAPFEDTATITLIDESSDTFQKGTDFDIIDDTGNGIPQTIDWSLSGDTPDEDELFSIVYTQKAYKTELEVVAVPEDIIRIGSGATFNKGTDFEIVDINQDGADDAILWNDPDLNIQDGEQFFLTYLTPGDINFENREKADPGTLSVNVI